MLEGDEYSLKERFDMKYLHQVSYLRDAYGVGIARSKEVIIPHGNVKKSETPEIGIPPSYRATRRYTKVHLGFCLRFSTLIGQLGRVPLFGAGPRRYIRSRLFRLAVAAFWRAFTASWRQKASERRYFLGPLARQNCLRILRP